MARTENIIIKSSEEIENITAENITLSASEVAHIKAIDKLAKALNAEIDAYKNAVREKYEHKKVTGKLVNLTIIDRFDFDKKLFEQENRELYERYKVLPVHQERVTF